MSKLLSFLEILGYQDSNEKITMDKFSPEESSSKTVLLSEP